MEIINTLRQPEYTGENRCIPCTIVNLAITVVIALVAGYYHRLLGGLISGVSLILIYLRGYLVPGTPTLTKRYLPATVLRWFRTDPDTIPVKSGFGGPEREQASATNSSSIPNQSDDRAIDYSPETEVGDPDAYFRDLGVLELCEDKDDLCLTAAFADRWSAAIDQIDKESISADQVATSFGVAEEDEEYEIENQDEGQMLIQDEMPVGQWPSNAALVADTGAATVLADLDPMWETRSPNQKGQLLKTLRLFLDDCPGEGGPIEYSEEIVESCCQSHNVLAVICGDSDERLVEFPLDEMPA